MAILALAGMWLVHLWRFSPQPIRRWSSYGDSRPSRDAAGPVKAILSPAEKQLVQLRRFFPQPSRRWSTYDDSRHSRAGAGPLIPTIIRNQPLQLIYLFLTLNQHLLVTIEV